MNIVGREKETAILADVWNAPQAEFVAVYGRRRVGKTHLVHEFFADKKSAFLEITGIKDGSMKEQLHVFVTALQQRYFPDTPLAPPPSWTDAFTLLTKLINKTKDRFVLFLDELPWLATPRSKMLQALDHFWNAEWSRVPGFKLIVCGSAAAWMLDQLIHAKGGLHNRLTKIIKLQPFDLTDTKKYLTKKNISWNNHLVAELFMAMGGIPYYLNQTHPRHSPAQVINETYFNRQGLMYDEFDKIFPSLFAHPQIHIRMVLEIAKKRAGISRNELLQKLDLGSGGSINRPLEELAAADFIQVYYPFGKNKKEQYYRVIDEYVLFYLKWMVPLKKALTIKPDHWQSQIAAPAYAIWQGYAFENLCQKHAHKILKAMDIAGMACAISTWRHVPAPGTPDRGAQIDLLIDRADGIISLCEIKYSIAPFAITKKYAQELRNKITVFKEKTGTRKTVNLVMITPCGLVNNNYRNELIARVVTLNDLF